MALGSPAVFSGTGASEEEAQVEQGHGSEVSPEYPAAPESVSEARRFVTATLDGSGADVDDAALLTSELCTNAVVHGHSVFTVTVDRFDETVRIGVVDRSGAEPRRRPYSTTSGTGRGIAIVAEVACAWGVERLGCGAPRGRQVRVVRASAAPACRR